MARVDDGKRRPLEVQCPCCRALFVYQPPPPEPDRDDGDTMASHDERA